MSTHVPPGNNTLRVSTERRRIAIALGMAGMCVVGLWWMMRWAGDLGGTNVTEKSLSRVEQIALINEYSPLAIPTSASDIHIKYQRFQDWNFSAYFTVPTRDFQTWTARLKPQARPKSSALGDASVNLYVGKQIGVFTGRIEARPKTRRIEIFHSSS